MQPVLDISACLPKSAYDYGNRSSGEAHGVVLTKSHVVELILDLVGYTPDRDLTLLRLFEPACGKGIFVLHALRRLLASAKRHGSGKILAGCLATMDIDPAQVDETRALLRAELLTHGMAPEQAEALVMEWVRGGDFLLESQPLRYDVIVGNPPYVRIEQLSPDLLAEYRGRFHSLRDRADLYVAFIERALELLTAEGRLSFICSDRWINNRYGAALRKLITTGYQVTAFVDLHNASPFDSEVIAYPSIFVLHRGPSSAPVPVYALKTASPMECDVIAESAKTGTPPPEDSGVTRADYAAWFQGDEPWVLNTPDHLAFLRELETRFLPLEATAKVGIGVATGNDQVYIVDRAVDVEADRLVPLVMREDIHCGTIRDAHRRIINPFKADGTLVNLAAHPRLAAYFKQHEESIRRRHVAQKNPQAWFRTIDRVYPDLVTRPKLLIPDIAGANEVACDEGHFHPHHNLYFVTSEQWDLQVLGALLSSRVALFFVWSYAVKMRGGYLRFQAQYLRRIRLPSPASIAPDLASRLRAAFLARNFPALDSLALEAYQLPSLPAFDFTDTRR